MNDELRFAGKGLSVGSSQFPVKQERGNQGQPAAPGLPPPASASPPGHGAQTNPILLVGRCLRGPNAPNKANWPGYRAKQTQFGPASREAGSLGGVKRAKQSQFGRAPSCNRVQWRQTNPIRAWGAATGGTERAKQTQFAPAQRTRWGKRDPKRDLSRLGARPTLRVGAIAPNKPNSQPGRQAGQGSWEGQTCETKPIRGGVFSISGNGGVAGSTWVR